MTGSDENIIKQLKQQITFSSCKNLLSDSRFNMLRLIEVTESLVESIRNSDNESEKLLIDLLSDETMQEFCRMNQYFSFNTESIHELKAIYREFIQRIKELKSNNFQSELKAISQKHYRKLCDWLVHSNPFAGKMYSCNHEYSSPVACSEYTPALQLSILHIDLKNLLEPVFDVGCGRELNLVNYLHENEIEAFGLDRFDIANPYYYEANWLEYNFEADKWGSIISNLGFSNHFIHHNLRADGNYKEYAQKYMKILGSLKIGGSFYYAPALPFIEMYLDPSKYQYTSFKIEGYEFKASQITRIS